MEPDDRRLIIVCVLVRAFLNGIQPSLWWRRRKKLIGKQDNLVDTRSHGAPKKKSGKENGEEKRGALARGGKPALMSWTPRPLFLPLLPREEGVPSVLREALAAVVRGGENADHCREARGRVLLVESVALVLGLGDRLRREGEKEKGLIEFCPQNHVKWPVSEIKSTKRPLIT